MRWDDVVYEPGTLEVVSYRNGARWATDVVKTAGPPAALVVQPDRSVIRADGADLCFITVRVLDANGVLAPRANDRIRFSIEGPGELVATDNGDPTSFVLFQSPERAAFNGLALAIVRARPGPAGRITLTAASAGLRSGVTSIAVERSP
jgi:beta-galactosidase